jgi:carboxypeptidase T
MKKGLYIQAVLILIIAVLSSNLVQATNDSEETSDKQVIVRAYYPDLATGNKVIISFEAQLLETNYEEGYHVLQVNQDQIDLLTRAGLKVEVDTTWTPDHMQHPTLPYVNAGIPGYPCYRTVEETFASAQQLAQAHPNLATWIDVGDSWQKSAGLSGYDMMVLRLTNSAIPGPKPVLFLMGAIHAREYATAELVMRFGEYLVNNYGIDPDATWILDNHEVHLLLHTNPDGRKKAETGLSWRKNTNQNYCSPTSNYRGADLNRNFAFQWACCGGSSSNPCDETYHGASGASEPEVQAVQNYMASVFADQRGPNLTDPAPADANGIVIDIHSYGKLVLWPWGFTSTTAPNATQLQTLGRKFAYWNGHSPEQAVGLYPTDGTSDDYSYGVLGVASYCFEVGTAFFQSCSYFENTLLPANLPALVYAAKVVRTPYMTPSGPDAINLALNSSLVPAGSPVTLSGTVNDTRYNNSNGTEPTQAVAAAEYYVDVPPWQGGAVAQPMAAADGSFNSSIENVQATVDTSGWSEGWHTLFVRGKDVNNNWGAFSALFVTISAAGNQSPVASFSYTCNNLACSFDGSASYDPDGTITSYAWTFGDGGTASGSTTSHTYATANTYNVGLTVTDDGGATGIQNQNVTVSSPPVVGDVVYVSSDSAGTAGGVAFQDEDILAYDTASSTWSLYFDGSDVGLGSNSNQDIDAFDLLPDGSILFSILGDTTISGLGKVDDSDLVRFVPTSLGANTAGSMSLYFDGSDVGLSTSGEDVDAVQQLADGRLVFSTADNVSVTGASGADEDLLVFTPTSLGANTSGTWALYFDGSDVGLSTAASEDVNGTWISAATGDIYLSTLGAFSVTGSSGDAADIFVCHPSSLGSTTACTFGPGLYWDGSTKGFAGEITDGISIVPAH